MFHNVGKGMPKYICLMRYNTKYIYGINVELNELNG